MGIQKILTLKFPLCDVIRGPKKKNVHYQKPHFFHHTAKLICPVLLPANTKPIVSHTQGPGNICVRSVYKGDMH